MKYLLRVMVMILAPIAFVFIAYDIAKCWLEKQLVDELENERTN